MSGPDKPPYAISVTIGEDMRALSRPVHPPRIKKAQAAKRFVRLRMLQLPFFCVRAAKMLALHLKVKWDELDLCL
jgi:hypothetical protein